MGLTIFCVVPTTPGVGGGAHRRVVRQPNNGTAADHRHQSARHRPVSKHICISFLVPHSAGAPVCARTAARPQLEYSSGRHCCVPHLETASGRCSGQTTSRLQDKNGFVSRAAGAVRAQDRLAGQQLHLDRPWQPRRQAAADGALPASASCVPICFTHMTAQQNRRCRSRSRGPRAAVAWRIGASGC